MSLNPDEAYCKRCNQIRLRADLVDGYCRRCASYPKTVLCRRCGKHVPKRDMYGTYCRWCVTVTREHTCVQCGVEFTTSTREGRRRIYCDDCKSPFKDAKKIPRYERYGLNETQFHAMYDKQSGRCAICLQPFNLSQLYIDHDHASGKVRGLLCPGCNGAIGVFKDDPKLFKRAIAYVLRYQESTTPNDGHDTVQPTLFNP